jgi:hypothetical protein
LFEFTFLLIITGTITFFAVGRLATDRFLHPSNLAIVSTVYYSVPLAIAGFLSYNPRGLIFLHTYAADPALAMQSLRFVVLAIVMISCGTFASRKIKKFKATYFFVIGRHSPTKANAGYIILLSIFALGLSLFGMSAFLEGYASQVYGDAPTLGNALMYFTLGAFGAVFAYVLLIGKVSNLSATIFLSLISLMVLLLTIIVRAKRLEIVSALLPAIIILLSQRKSIKLTTTRLIVVGSALTALTAIAAIRIGDEFDSFTVPYYILSEGLYAGHSLPGVLGNLETGTLSFENGARFLNSLLGFIPRFLWGGKDDLVYAGNFVLNSVSPLGATNLLAEVVLQGGIIAVSVTYFIMGFIFDRLMKFEAHWDKGITTGSLPARFIGYLIAIAVFIPHFRDGIVPAVKISLQMAVVFVFLFGIRSATEIKKHRVIRKTGRKNLI